MPKGKKANRKALSPGTADGLSRMDKIRWIAGLRLLCPDDDLLSALKGSGIFQGDGGIYHNAADADYTPQLKHYNDHELDEYFAWWLETAQKRMSELKLLPDSNAEVINPLRKKSMLKIIAGIAKREGFKASMGRSPAAKRIEGMVAETGLAIEEDTVRSVLEEVRALLQEAGLD